MVPYTMIAGGIMDAIGTGLMGMEADERKEKQETIANTPGLDTGMITGQALADMLQYLPQGSALAQKISQMNQANLTAQEEAALPGVGAARQEALGKIKGLFSDDAEWLKGVQRRGAALGLSSGLFGSQAGQLSTLKLSDTESMARTQLGTSLLGSLIGGMRIANTPGVQAFLGPNPSELVNLRSRERTQRLQMLSGANMLPTQMETWGNEMQEVGKSMAGVGMGSSMMGGALGGNGMLGGTQYYGMNYTGE